MVDRRFLILGSMTSFATILTQHGETLHNHDHSHILEPGRMMLTDAGAERVTNYCSDHTRTVPVGGKFEGRQKDVYNIVLACHDKALEITRPGITYMSVHLEVCKVLVQGLKDLGLMKAMWKKLLPLVHTLYSCPWIRSYDGIGCT